MVLRRHAFHARAEPLPERGRSLDRGGVAVWRRRHDGQPALEEVGVGVLRSAFLGAGQRMTADERHAGRQSPLDRGDDGGLGAAGVGQQRSRFAARRQLDDLGGDAVHRRAEHGQVRGVDGRGGVEAGLVDGADDNGGIEAGLLASDAKDAASQAASAGGQADGAADQSDADDGQGVDAHSRWRDRNRGQVSAPEVERNDAAEDALPRKRQFLAQVDRLARVHCREDDELIDDTGGQGQHRQHRDPGLNVHVPGRHSLFAHQHPARHR